MIPISKAAQQLGKSEYQILEMIRKNQVEWCNLGGVIFINFKKLENG